MSYEIEKKSFDCYRRLTDYIIVSTYTYYMNNTNAFECKHQTGLGLSIKFSTFIIDALPNNFVHFTVQSVGECFILKNCFHYSFRYKWLLLYLTVCYEDVQPIR